VGWIALSVFRFFYFTLHNYGTGEVGVPENFSFQEYQRPASSCLTKQYSMSVQILLVDLLLSLHLSKIPLLYVSLYNFLYMVF